MIGSQLYSTRDWDALHPGMRGLAALGEARPCTEDPNQPHCKVIKMSAGVAEQRAAECELYQATGRLPGRLSNPPPIGSSPSLQEKYLANQAAATEQFVSSCGGGGAKSWLLALGGLATIGVAVGILYSKKSLLGF